MTHLLEDLKSFLNNSPTSWHAALEIGNRLALKEFIPLNENEKWHLEQGKKYFVQRGGSLCAFILPTMKPECALILGSHTDSPSLKIKPNPLILTENMITIGVEVYGSPLLTSWLNRDLAIAGRIVVSDKEGNLEEKLIFIDDAPLIIPQLAIHLDREVNEKGVILNKQDHLAAIACLQGKPESSAYLEKVIRRQHFFNALISYDLFLVPMEESRFIGHEGEMLASHRLDNLASAHASVVALVSAKSPLPHTLQMGLFWDHEEIGSSTSEGALSPFGEDLLKRISFCLNLNDEEFFLLKHRSFALSIDMAHAFNPNYSHKHEINHRPLLGKGIVIKFNANQKYVSNAPQIAIIIEACHKLNLPFQNYVARSDMISGSTIGPLFSATTGIRTLDIGCAQLSMHATREIISCADHLGMCQLLTYLLEHQK